MKERNAIYNHAVYEITGLILGKKNDRGIYRRCQNKILYYFFKIFSAFTRTSINEYTGVTI